LQYAGEQGIHPEITIFQERNFDELGSNVCKGCAGILSISLLRNLDELGLTIPDEIIQGRIDHYAVHSPFTSISISNPEKEIQIVSIYRGGGPRLSGYENPISFDGWLLRKVQERGVRVEIETVSHIYLKKEAKVEVGDKQLEYDLIVLASGVNAKPTQILGVDYVPPEMQTMAQDELSAETAQVESRLGNAAHAFLISSSGLIFGTLTPKKQFINVSVLSRGKQPVSVTDFLKYDFVRRLLPDRYKRACGCRPTVVVGPARNYYADRFVAVGDASVSRLYKDGIGSSLLTAREAARTAVYHGVSGQDFGAHYHPFCKSMNSDNWWGRLLFAINDRAKDSRIFLLAQHRLIGDEQDNATGPQPFSKCAWGMFTGIYSYRSIARMLINPASLAKLSWALFRETSIGLFRKEVTSHRRLHVGRRKVLILGSGFGGTYVLRCLVKALNKNENVETTMVSDENFFLFSPLLHEVAMGRIETRHVAYPIRRLHWRDRFNFVQASVQKIDLNGRKVITTEGILDFDCLVLALGSVADMTELNHGAAKTENIFTLKTLHDSRLIRNHVIGIFERASIERDPERQKQLLTFVVSGGGYTGVQVITELRDFIFRSLIKYYRTIDPGKINIIMIEAEHKIVAELHPKLGAYASKQIQRMGIKVRLRSRITQVGEDHVVINGAEIVSTSTLIWLAGVVANPRIAELDVLNDSIGRVLVNEYLEVPGITSVYAVGDCAHFDDQKSGQPIPPRAHTGVRQARIAAHNILAEIRGRDKKPYRYSKPAELVSLGASKAMFRFHDLRLYGFLARLIWVGAYSLLITGTYNRIRIVMDWLLSIVFGRDTSLVKLEK
jgi:NADH dehydrogenase